MKNISKKYQKHIHTHKHIEIQGVGSSGGGPIGVHSANNSFYKLYSIRQQLCI